MGSTPKQGRTCKWCKEHLDFINPSVIFCNEQCQTFYRRSESMEQYLRQSGVPMRFLRCSMDNFEGKTPAFSELANFPHKTTMVYLTGNVGAGKTHCAVAMLRAAATRDVRQCRFAQATELLLELRSTMGTVVESERDVMQKYLGSCILALDDVGAEKPSEYVRQCWYSIIERRYANMLPTIVTSNMPLDELAAVYGDRTASRLASGCVLKFNGPDFRMILNSRSAR